MKHLQVDLFVPAELTDYFLRLSREFTRSMVDVDDSRYTPVDPVQKVKDGHAVNAA